MADGSVAVGFDEKPMTVIYGQSEGRPISLFKCSTMHSRGSLFIDRPNFHRIYVQRALVGAHVESAYAKVFRACHLRFENLTMWAQLPSIVRKTNWKDGVATATITSGDSVDVEYEGWTYSLRNAHRGFSYEQTRERNEVTGDTTSVLTLVPSSPSSTSDFDGPTLELMDLLTLASGEACGLISAVFEHMDVDVIERRGEEPIERPIEVSSFGRRIHTAEPTAPARAFSQFRFTCQDAGFADILTKWLPLRRRASDASNVFFGTKYSTPGFTETRLLLQAVAAEAYHAALYDSVTDLDAATFSNLRARIMDALDTSEERDWVKRKLRNDPTLRERLIALAAVPDSKAVEIVVPDIDVWAGEMVKARNGLAHAAGVGLGANLFDLERSTSSLITLVLMQELGLDAEVQQRAADTALSQ